MNNLEELKYKKNWDKLTCTLIREFEEHTKYLFHYHNYDNDKDRFVSKPSWLFNYFEEDGYSESICLSIYKNEMGQYKRIRYYAFDSVECGIVCAFNS